MKKIITVLCYFIPLLASSQGNTNLIQAYLNTERNRLDLSPTDIQDWVIESTASSHTTKITNYYIKQRVSGIEVFPALSNVWVKEGKVIHIGNRFISNASEKTNTTIPVLGVLQALNKAKNALHLNSDFTFEVQQALSATQYKITNVSGAEPIRAELVFEQKSENQLRLAWDFMIDSPQQNHFWSIRIDAVDGAVLAVNDFLLECHFNKSKTTITKGTFFESQMQKQNWTPANVLSGSYRVIPFNFESPNHSSRQLISSPHNANASPFGWHDTNGLSGADEIITKGNNVHAFGDLNDADDPEMGISASGGAGLTFDFPYGGINVPAINYLDAATTNLFYMNNIMHDVFYQYGFDEASGNFQLLNYTGEADGDDAVLAQSQDGGGINNANFSTPPDGINGRMQMYLWDRNGGQDYIEVVAPTSATGFYTAFDNSFILGHIPPPVAPAFIQGELVLANDAQDETSDACSPLNSAAVSGKIVVIRRGICTATEKVLAAQEAGAIAVILVNNTAGNYLLGGLGDSSISIPALSMKMEAGEQLISLLGNGAVSAKLSASPTDFVNVDGDFDNLVIAHEYGHGISIRLTGGRNNSSCLYNAEQMGEGWSDWFGLMMQMKVGDSGEARRGVGTFVLNESVTGDGIRTYPYSTDMAVNPFTFADTNTLAVPHGVGSVWATMLWDLTWAYVAKYGFDSNIYTGNGGNNKVLRLVIDALKLQPCRPSFTDARDAIIAADLNTTGGMDYCLIWEVFARRGLGVNADSGDEMSSTDQVEDFTTPPSGPNCTLGSNTFDNQNLFRLFPNPATNSVTLSIQQYSGKISIRIMDSSGRLIVEEINTDFNHEKQIDTHRLRRGLYLVQVQSEEQSQTLKLLIE